MKVQCHLMGGWLEDLAVILLPPDNLIFSDIK